MAIQIDTESMIKRMSPVQTRAQHIAAAAAIAMHGGTPFVQEHNEAEAHRHLAALAAHMGYRLVPVNVAAAINAELGVTA